MGLAIAAFALCRAEAVLLGPLVGGALVFGWLGREQVADAAGLSQLRDASTMPAMHLARILLHSGVVPLTAAATVDDGVHRSGDGGARTSGASLPVGAAPAMLGDNACLVSSPVWFGVLIFFGLIAIFALAQSQLRKQQTAFAGWIAKKHVLRSENATLAAWEEWVQAGERLAAKPSMHREIPAIAKNIRDEIRAYRASASSDAERDPNDAD